MKTCILLFIFGDNIVVIGVKLFHRSKLFRPSIACRITAGRDKGKVKDARQSHRQYGGDYYNSKNVSHASWFHKTTQCFIFIRWIIIF